MISRCVIHGPGAFMISTNIDVKSRLLACVTGGSTRLSQLATLGTTFR